MTVTNSKAKAMGMFLKSRRERLSPEDAGLEFTSGQRKTPGLRREEVAVLAGVSVTYYTWLEQGRDLIPSRDVIDSIAQALQLSPAEKSHLYQLWNPHASETPLATPAVVDPQMQKIIDQLAFPSHITNERTEVLAWNKAAQEMFFDFASIPVQERYFIRLLFENTEIRSRIVNIEEFSNYSVGIFRTYYDKHRGDPWFETTVEHLIRNNVEFEQIWKQYDVQLKKVKRIFLHPPNVYQTYDIQSLVNLTDSPDIHICIYTPVTDDPTADC
ncbi:helix-turn-helix transcriptional regulator [Paenibacillus dokdonensis]|uniref:Helix-turn-helix transcriptional regulator n=1 Tax=Paenibacillus dokdonensis TaxID=2567944 RepID=A0ABU6GMQ2_9BACL|nr:helix-turn-helix transcriptional regulator [Paenibacillus dokdonensis]MEC0240659.1 helix-turn-helix transcriptional regulator [Paenibacillus dokdonensis]